jgi:hypothetical protein
LRGRISGRGGFPAVGGSQVRRSPVPRLPTYLSLARGTIGSSCRMPNPIALGRVPVEGFLSCNTSPFHQHPAPTCCVFFDPARPLPAERFSSIRTLVVTKLTVVTVAFLQQRLLGHFAGQLQGKCRLHSNNNRGTPARCGDNHRTRPLRLLRAARWRPWSSG